MNAPIKQNEIIFSVMRKPCKDSERANNYLTRLFTPMTHETVKICIRVSKTRDRPVMQQPICPLKVVFVSPWHLQANEQHFEI